MRKTITDHPYDQEKLSSIIRDIIGGQTQVNFAKKAGISPAYLSKILTGFYEVPPSPETLYRIYEASNPVDPGYQLYISLFDAAGLNPDKYWYFVEDAAISDVDLSKPKNNYQDLYKSIITASLQSEMKESTVSITLGSDMYDLVVNIFTEGNNKLRWLHYCFIAPDDDMPSDHNRLIITNNLCNYYGRLSMWITEPNQDIFLVTSSRRTADCLNSNPPRGLNAHIYVVLLDINNNTIVSQNELLTQVKTDDIIDNHT